MQRRQRGREVKIQMRKLMFSLVLSLILSIVISVAPVLASAPAGSVPCCH